VKFYVSALVGVIVKVILQNAPCNNKDDIYLFIYLFITKMDQVYLYKITAVKYVSAFIVLTFAIHTRSSVCDLPFHASILR